MSIHTSPYAAYVTENFTRFVNELQEWLTIPSISADPAYSADVARAATWAASQLKTIGFPHVEVIETATHPLVFAEYIVDENLPTVLFYGHFDVQPAEPLNEWISEPFSPTIRNGNLYARGAADDKGQVMLVLKALETLMKIDGTLPVNVKVLLEGEEETTGEAIDAFVRAHPERLAASCVLICDTHMLDENNPVLMTGLRGMLYTELTIHGAASDLHSGLYGGVAPNPLHALCHVIVSLKDAHGNITIAGLEELLPEPGKEELQFWQEDPLNLAENYRSEMGVTQLVGPEKISPLQRVMAWPTVEVHGIQGGFVGIGTKTVIPAKATAKISLRLPGGVAPEDVWQLMQSAIQQAMPAGYHYQLSKLAGGEGLVVSSEKPALRAAAHALENVYLKQVGFVRSGGSIPVATLFHQVLQLPVVLMGFGLPDDHLHAPNEKFSLKQFQKGLLAVIVFMQQMRQT